MVTHRALTWAAALFALRSNNNTDALAAFLKRILKCFPKTDLERGPVADVRPPAVSLKQPRGQAEPPQGRPVGYSCERRGSRAPILQVFGRQTCVPIQARSIS